MKRRNRCIRSAEAIGGQGPRVGAPSLPEIADDHDRRRLKVGVLTAKPSRLRVFGLMP